MVVRGCAWLCVVVHGCACLCMVVHGCAQFRWTHLARCTEKLREMAVAAPVRREMGIETGGDRTHVEVEAKQGRGLG